MQWYGKGKDVPPPLLHMAGGRDGLKIIRVMTLSLIYYSTQENGPCISPGQLSSADPGDEDPGELYGVCENERDGPTTCQPWCGEGERTLSPPLAPCHL